MKILKEILNGALLIELPQFEDDRGVFVKTFNDDAFQKLGVDFILKESYYSFSHQDVIRGMHFQLPPFQHSKIVFCPQGKILDVIVDLRKDSPTYGQCHAEKLSAANHRAYFIPEGFAHGFLSLQNHSLTYYLVSSGYEKESDTGIHYDSINYEWPVQQPILSTRDLSFETLQNFNSPF